MEVLFFVLIKNLISPDFFLIQHLSNYLLYIYDEIYLILILISYLMETLFPLKVFSQQITFLKLSIKITNKAVEQQLVQNFDPPYGIFFVVALKGKILTLIWVSEGWRNFSNIPTPRLIVTIFY